MFRKSRKAEQSTEPQQEVTARKSRFQIVKLEERIAPAKGGIPGPEYHCNRWGGGGHCFGR